MKNPEFLKQKYDLHNTPEVKSAAKRTEKRIGEKVPPDPEAQIQNYLDRLEKLILDPDKEQKRKLFGKESRPRALSFLREMIMNEYVRPNKEHLAQGAAAVEERAARNLGMDLRYGEEELDLRGEIAVTDLEKSLDNWIAYLSDTNEPYPTWFRYYAFRNILNLGDYDKDKKEFTKRSKGSTRLFPEIDRGALAYVQERLEAAENPEMLEKLRHAQKAAANNDIPQTELLTKEKAKSFASLSFAKQYAEGLSQAGEITPEMRKITEGKWVKYQKETDPTALWASLQNKGTAWCTKGFATAETQLKGGDFYVYYTLDKKGNTTIPRIAIRLQGENISEVRGVADGDQNLEGNMAEIAAEKLKEFSDSGQYEKKTNDMKLLTIIEKKTKNNEQLTQDELIFLYEINASIEGFGYKKDPRIKELREARDKNADMLIIFDCESSQIVHNEQELKKAIEQEEDVKAYVGKLFPNIFKLLPESLEHIYTEFPEGKIRRKTIQLGTGLKTQEDFLQALKEKSIQTSDWAKDIMSKAEFKISQKETKEILIILSVADLGFKDGAKIKDIFAKAKELGLELCPPETGPQLRLQYFDQPNGEYCLIGMEPIADSDGDPGLFSVYRGDGEPWLSASHGRPGGFCNGYFRFAFVSASNT